ncbi:MAG: transposase [Armatimonadetes bacterium]|nr:transposase [Armatimonadota bacterium]
MSSPTATSRDAIRAVYDAGPDAVVGLVEGLLAHITDLEARVQAWEDRLVKDSHHSSKPPSSDGGRQKTQSLRGKSGKAPGGQPGHPGKTLAMVAEPDRVVVHTPGPCRCGAALEGVGREGRERRQVWALPVMRLEVTEHPAHRKRCPACGRWNTGVFPDEVREPVSYGPRLKAVGVYLRGYHLLPYERLSEVFADLRGVSISPGTLCQALQDASGRLAPVEAQIQAGWQQAPVVHADETGLRIAGKRQWLHGVGTKPLTHDAPHPKRERAAPDAIGILPGYEGGSCMMPGAATLPIRVPMPCAMPIPRRRLRWANPCPEDGPSSIRPGTCWRG